MSEAPTFGGRTTGLLLAAGIVLAGMFALLTAYGPDLKSGNDGGGHALSNSAVGFSGLVALAQATGVPTSYLRDSRNIPEGGLLVLTPPAGSDPAAIARLVAARVEQPGAAPVLLILPKWVAVPRQFHPGWVENAGQLPVALSAAPAERVASLSLAETSGPQRCCLTGDKTSHVRVQPPPKLRILQVPDSKTTELETIVDNADGDAVVAWRRSNDLAILADPDLLDNHGIRDPQTARSALALLNNLGADHGGVIFDLTLNGFERSHNIARLVFEPPLLALTLCLLAAAALAGWQAAIRFGVPRQAPRAIAFGKRALVDNAAALIRSARREPGMAVRYAALMRDAAASARGAPAQFGADEQAAWLDRRATGPARFADVAAAAAEATTPEAALAAARAAHAWKEDVTHDG